MYYYTVYGTRAADGVEEILRTFDRDMELTDQEARESAMNYELVARRNEKYKSCRVQRSTMVLK